MKVINVVGARPNFVKIAELINIMKKYPEIISVLVHTGQHYDYEMSKQFFEDLNIPSPDIYLGVGSSSHAIQTAKIMIEFEKVISTQNPDLIVVVGDVNSTIACALTAIKMNVKIAHIEAGLRSFDRTMPEEINRLLTDAISDYLFITEKSAKINLLKEGIPKAKIYMVGNIMIDTLIKNKDKAKKTTILNELNLTPNSYALLTLHRPNNVDIKENLDNILDGLAYVQKYIKILFPAHPRTLKRIQEYKLLNKINNMKNFILISPLSYLNFLRLMMEAKFVLTDSGGIQEETTFLQIPCLTLRENTERPITVEEGTNTIVGCDKEKIIENVSKIINGDYKKGKIPPLWDGNTANRIVDILRRCTKN
jgi:UDP-N-acetylglucosamine 2-epimerase (non-hydrolysing)